MEQAITNPPSNSLGSGVSESDLVSAVEHSGYPLQTIVANILRKNFYVQDEWSYLDRDTKELRTIDILTQKDLYDFTKEQPRVRPTLNLLIECKQSDLPYIFFLSPSKPWLREFPIIAGLAQNNLTITTDDSASTWHYSILDALGLDKHRFLSEPEYCYTFSKCMRKGKDLELSGSESYNNLILPIIKSLLHFQNAEKPPDTAVYFDGHLVVGVGVLSAPMVGVRISDQSNDLVFLPWVRVVRHEYFENSERIEKSRLFAVDVVHKDFFETYVKNHLMPYAYDFASLAIKHQQILASGKAFASRMERSGWGNIEPRLDPRHMKATTTRTKIILKNILRLLTGKKPIG